MEKIFSRLREEITKKDNIREELITKSRPIIKNSKQAIYALHRGSIKEAEELMSKAKKSLDELKKLDVSYVGAYNAALQEYGEAVSFYHYIKKGNLIDSQELGLDVENYLLALCDLTGELARRAVYSVVDEKFSEVIKIKEFVSKIFDEFLKFEFRNGELRKKSDSIKWNLKKIEEIMYDLKIRGKI